MPPPQLSVRRPLIAQSGRLQRARQEFLCAGSRPELDKIYTSSSCLQSPTVSVRDTNYFHSRLSNSPHIGKFSLCIDCTAHSCNSSIVVEESTVVVSADVLKYILLFQKVEVSIKKYIVFCGLAKTNPACAWAYYIGYISKQYICTIVSMNCWTSVYSVDHPVTQTNPITRLRLPHF